MRSRWSAAALHLQKLKSAGLVAGEKQGQYVRYSIQDQRLYAVMAALKEQYTYACKNCEQETGEANIVKAVKEPALLPGSFASAEAVAYLTAQKFVMYSPLYRLELSNNRAERSIKPFVMGRKNWLFANTPGGAQASAVIYSLIETAKENGLDPYQYLLWILRNAPQLSETDEAWAESLLPANAPEECYMPHK